MPDKPNLSGLAAVVMLSGLAAKPMLNGLASKGTLSGLAAKTTLTSSESSSLSDASTVHGFRGLEGPGSTIFWSQGS